MGEYLCTYVLQFAFGNVTFDTGLCKEEMTVKPGKWLQTKLMMQAPTGAKVC